jgi:hypothetical protein
VYGGFYVFFSEIHQHAALPDYNASYNLIVYFRQKLLNFSLTHCDPNAIEALLHSRSLLQTEVCVCLSFSCLKKNWQ